MLPYFPIPCCLLSRVFVLLSHVLKNELGRWRHLGMSHSYRASWDVYALKVRDVTYEAYKKKQHDENQWANLVSDKPSLDNLCLSTGFDLTIDKWFINSGASFHCTSQREIYDDYASGDFEQVVVGNGHMCPIVGKWAVTMNIYVRKILNASEHVEQVI